jgi:Calponin homology (CH) domain
LTNIGAEDIVDSNPKLLLGLIWTIILRFTIADISEEGLTAKEGLLLWCQRRTAPYASDFKIKEFTFSWQDGLALCGLIHRHRPDLLDYYKLDKKQKAANTQLAMDIAEQHLGIAKLLDVEDLVGVAKPDERSVMTYVAQYFHAFSAQDKFGVAGRRVGNLGNVLAQVWDMQNDYERRVRVLLGDVSCILSQWNRSKTTGLADARNQLKEFESYKGTTKREWIAERHELDTLLGNIQTKLKTYNLRSYTPPAGLTLSDLKSAWEGLVSSEASRKLGLTKFIRETKDTIRKEYAHAANSFNEVLSALSVGLSQVSGELNDQLSNTKALQAKAAPLKKQIEHLQALDAHCIEANIEDNEFTIFSVEDLIFDLSLLNKFLSKKISFIENQVVARTKTNFTPEQLEEYSETFKFFDKDQSNTLVSSEFKAALAAQGTNFTEEEFTKKFLQVSQGSDQITFEQVFPTNTVH